MEKIIDRMTLEDLSQVIEIEKAVFSNPWEEEMFYSSLTHYHCWKLFNKSASRIIGYLIGEKVMDEFSIYNLAICKEYQKQGLGSWFTRGIINHMRDYGARVFFLEVRRSNNAALRLYERLGFKEIYFRKGYYSEPLEDAIVMMKDERNIKRDKI
ncbi:MAG: ribosomal protein S18-alanine N-acetyltransferase [Candidatus Stygibacter frigidus]|nr:ribosomal protein S18-alanine N-acetyltransferase [Candidatus Stygibacter frigidus]